jgi:hypothetical protein
MIKIITDFDSRKFQRELEREVKSAAEQAVRDKLKPLTRKGLGIQFRTGRSDQVNATLSGPDHLIEEAERLLED